MTSTKICKYCHGKGGCIDAGWWFECSYCSWYSVDKPQESVYNAPTTWEILVNNLIKGL